jgi:hypothetical protein
LLEKAGKDNVYVGTIKKTGNIRFYSVSGEMYNTISKWFLKGITGSSGIVIGKAKNLWVYLSANMLPGGSDFVPTIGVVGFNKKHGPAVWISPKMGRPSNPKYSLKIK